MSRFYLSIFILAVSLPAFSQGRQERPERRNLLVSAYPKSLVNEILVKDLSWVPYPAYKDRESWEKIPESLRLKYVEAGERYLNYRWPVVRATEYLEFTRTGDRQVMERPQGQRMKALQTLFFAELMEGKGRFLDDLVNGVFSFCEQTSWMLSACMDMHKDRTTNLPDIDDPIIDLWVGDMASDLSWIWYFFHDEFDMISPIISRRLKNELSHRILTQFYERNDYWWITGTNNWNPWCNYNVLTCIMLMEDDPVKKIDAVYKTITSVDLFFNSYPEDGGCDEGPGYWGLAGAKAFGYLSLLEAASKGKISLFNHPLVKEIGRYIYRVHIADGIYYINFADARPKTNPPAGIVYRYGRKIEDTPMTEFGAFLLSKEKYGERPEIETLGTTLENLFGLQNWQNTPKNELLIADYYFNDLQVFVARDKAGTTDGFYVAAKGGNNAESHNHNDVGSCIVFYNGNPVFVDVGPATYTGETFGRNRYQIWPLQSNYHNLPLINGVAQTAGRRYAAKNAYFSASKSKATFSTDIAEAYPAEAQADSWVRSYTLDRGKKITITDKFRLKELNDVTQLRYMTPLQCTVLHESANGRMGESANEQGIIEMKGDNFVLRAKYDPKKLSARIEKKEVDDSTLRIAWGDEIFILIFDVVSKNKSDQISIDIVNYK